MAEKRFYWLKLKRDFFKRHDIRIIEEMPNGKDYVLFYLKLMLESIDHEGALRFSDTIPYNEQMLSVITNTNIDVVRAAMEILTQLKMVVILDNETIYMTEVQKLTGSESTSAERVRKHRANLPEKQETLPGNADVTKVTVTCNTEKEIEIETEIETDTDSEREECVVASAPTPPLKRPAPKPETHRYGQYGWVRLTEKQHACLLADLGAEELSRCITYIDESAQSNGNKNKWRDWSLVIRRCHRDGWGRKAWQAAQPKVNTLGTLRQMLEDTP